MPLTASLVGVSAFVNRGGGGTAVAAPVNAAVGSSHGILHECKKLYSISFWLWLSSPRLLAMVAIFQVLTIMSRGLSRTMPPLALLYLPLLLSLMLLRL